jgi:hypothetical protein
MIMLGFTGGCARGIASGLFTTFYANTPDVERFAGETFPSVLMIGASAHV